MSRILIVFVVLIFGVACKKDRPDDTAGVAEISGAQGVFIGSEGNFQFGNSSLSYYDYSSDEVSNDVYQNANSSVLGDVLQSIYQDASTMYLVMNNSSKIEMMDRYTFKSKGAIDGFVSPRCFLPVSNSKAYVTDLYSNSIQVVDLNQNNVVSSLKTSGWTEEMLLLYGKAFVCKSKDLLYVIDTSTDKIVDSITVGFSPSSLQQDKNGMLWVLCQGSLSSGAELPGLYQVNPVSFAVEKIFKFSVGDQVSKLNINGGNDTLFYLCNTGNKGVNKLSINANSLPSSPFIAPNSGENYYGLGVNPRNGDVFVSDAVDYLQKSTVSRYDRGGKFLNYISAGINTSSFSFN